MMPSLRRTKVPRARRLSSCAGSFAHVLAAAEMQVYLDPASAPAAARLLEHPAGDLAVRIICASPSCLCVCVCCYCMHVIVYISLSLMLLMPVQTCSQALQSIIRTFKASDDTVLQFRKRCHTLFPLASVFADDDAPTPL